jgi:peptidyl-Lys metalloendopeptidase
MSKMRPFTWLFLGLSASALVMSGCVAPDVDEAGPTPGTPSEEEVAEPAAGDLSVKLSANKLTVGTKEAVTVTLSLTNAADHPVRVLSWYVPGDELEEDVFEVTLQGQAVDFIGPHYKRPAAEDTDYVTIAPGKTLTYTADLTAFYDFSQSGDYQIRYAADYLPAGEKDHVTIQSNGAKLWVEAHAYAQVGAPTSLAYTKCTTTQQDTVVQALAAAKAMADNSTNYLTVTAPSGTPRYKTWFGTFSSGGWSTAKSHFVAIQDALYNKPMAFNCGCKKQYYAYVYPSQPYNVYLCSAFWSAPMTGTDSKGGTIIHETSHFTAVAGTNDYAYGQSAAKNLATSDPNKALNNADNHEYFAENTPFLQ